MTYKITTIENWLKWQQWFIDNGYKPWQFQHSIECKEGFHTWFMKSEQEDIEIYTYNAEVYKGIMKFNKEDRK